MNFRRIAVRSMAWSLVLAGMVGCGGNSSSNEPADVQVGDLPADFDASPTQTKIEFQLFETTKVIEGEALTALTAVGSDGTLTVKAGSAWGDTLASGQVLVMGMGTQTPYGMLREVVSVEANGDGANV